MDFSFENKSLPTILTTEQLNASLALDLVPSSCVKSCCHLYCYELKLRVKNMEVLVKSNECDSMLMLGNGNAEVSN